jgi:hypothetical protein
MLAKARVFNQLDHLHKGHGKGNHTRACYLRLSDFYIKYKEAAA